MFKKILGLFILWKTIVYIFVFLAVLIIPLQLKFTAAMDFGVRLPYYIWVFGNFDGMHYMEIARNGYHNLEHPFFPLYPLSIKLIFSIFNLFKSYIPYLIAAQFVSNLSFIVSLYIISKLVLLDNKKKISGLILLAIIFFPTSSFYAATYNDSLFFLLATLTIYFSRRKNWIISSIFGALATLTRLNGLALIFIIIIEYFSLENLNNSWDYKKNFKSALAFLSFNKIIKSRILFALLIPFSFFGYLAYTHLSFGDWNLVFSSMQVWNQQHITFPGQVVWRYLKIIFTTPNIQFNYFVAILEFLFVLFYIFMLVYSYKKIRFSYWVFFAVSILIPSLTGTFQGMPRYGLHIYPLFLSMALFLEKKDLKYKIIYFAISILLMFLFTGFFTRGYFVA